MDKTVFQLGMKCPEGTLQIEQRQDDEEHLLVTSVMTGPTSTGIAGPLRMTKKQADMLARMLQLWATGKVS